MVKYIIFLQKPEAEQFIQQIDTCLGYPNDSGTITYAYPDLMCEYDEATGESWQIGWGVELLDDVIPCMTEQQVADILILPANINSCVLFSGSTI
jgi:hypothetical protein